MKFKKNCVHLAIFGILQGPISCSYGTYLDDDHINNYGTNRYLKNEDQPFQFSSSAHACLLAYDMVQCVGYNYYGQIGQSTSDAFGTPVQLNFPSGIRGTAKPIKVVTGYDHTCILFNDKHVWCNGSNGFGQLGNGGTVNSETPVQVKKNGVVLTNVIDIEAGPYHNCAIQDTGAMYCWGFNADGQLGMNSIMDGSTNEKKASIMALSMSATCVITEADTTKVNCIGFNYSSNDNGFTIVDLVDAVTTQTGKRGLTAGSTHFCALLDNTKAKCWGTNQRGQLGIGSAQFTSDYISTPVFVLQDSAGTELSGITNINAGYASTCLVASGNPMCFGYNHYYQLGIANGGANILYPTLVTPFDNITGKTLLSMHVGEYTGHAVFDDDSVYSLGTNYGGTFGDGSPINSRNVIGDTSNAIAKQISFVVGSSRPSSGPSSSPSSSPSVLPSLSPSSGPSNSPSSSPSVLPSLSPSSGLSNSPSSSPSDLPSLSPSSNPSQDPYLLGDENSFITFDNVDFGSTNSIKGIKVTYANGETNGYGSVEIKLGDDASGTTLAQFSPSGTMSWVDKSNTMLIPFDNTIQLSGVNSLTFATSETTAVMHLISYELIDLSERFTPFTTIDATEVSDQSGIGCSNVCAYFNENGKYLTYSPIDFGLGTNSIKITYSKATTGGRLEIRKGDVNGEVIGDYFPSSTGGWDVYQTVDIPIKTTFGINELTFIARDTVTGVMNLKTFQLSPEHTLTNVSIGPNVDQSVLSYNSADRSYSLIAETGDVYIAPDSFVFAKIHMVEDTSDFSVVVHIKDVPEYTGSEFWIKYGLMLRESDYSGSKYVACLTRRQQEDVVAMMWRDTVDATPIADYYSPFFVFNLSLQGVWLKLARSGDTYQCSYKVNENDVWIDMSSTKTFAMNSQLDVGVFLSTHDGPAETITFNNLSTSSSGGTVKIVENGIQTSDSRLRNSNLVTQSDTAGAYLSVPGSSTATSADNWNVYNLPIGANDDFVMLAKLKVDGSGSAASFFINDLDNFSFDGSSNQIFTHSNSAFYAGFVEVNKGTHHDNLFYFKVERKLGTIKFYINDEEVASTANYNVAISRFYWRPWRADLKIYDWIVSGPSLLDVPITFDLPPYDPSMGDMIHAMCLSRASQASATSNYNSSYNGALSYTPFLNFSNGQPGWDDRDYTIQNVDNTVCNGGIYLKPSNAIVRDVAAAITVSAVPSNGLDFDICVIVSSDGRDGGWLNFLPTQGFTLQSASLSTTFQAGITELNLLCKTIAPSFEPSSLPSSLPSSSPSSSPSVLPSLSPSSNPSQDPYLLGDENSFITFDNVDFGSANSVKGIKVTYANGESNGYGSVEIKLGDNTSGTTLAQFSPSGTKTWVDYRNTMLIPFDNTVQLSGVNSLTFATSETTAVMHLISYELIDLSERFTPFTTINASEVSNQSGIATVNTVIGYFDNGDYFTYSPIDFGLGANSIKITYEKWNNGGRLEIRKGDMNGEIIGNYWPASTGGGGNYITVDIPIKTTFGINELTFIARDSPGGGFMNLNSFQLSPVSAGYICLDSTARTQTESVQAATNAQTGADLVSIRCGAQQNAVASLPIISGTYTWIGGTDVDNEGTWVLPDGNAMTYSNWNTGQPNNGGGNEDCIAIESNGLWSDGPCNSSTHPAIFESTFAIAGLTCNEYVECQDTVKIVENGIQTSDTRLRNNNLVTQSDTAGAYLSVPGRASPIATDKWHVYNLPIGANDDFVVLAKLKVDGSGSGAAFFIHDLDIFGFDSSSNQIFAPSASAFYAGFVEANKGTHSDNLFYFKVERKLGTIKFYINDEEVASTANYNVAISKFTWRPWRGDLKIYDWIVSGPSLLNFDFSASGGDYTESGGYGIHTFTSSGTFTVNSGTKDVEFLIIAGGGSGGVGVSGNDCGGGGGGAGGYISSVVGESSGGGCSPVGKVTATSGSYPIVVGAGGSAVVGSNMAGLNGGNSSAFGHTAIGGGGGSNRHDTAGKPGGSGGGGSCVGYYGSGQSCQGYQGGGGQSTPSGGTYGGGGAGGFDSTARSGVGGPGGAGVTSSITGVATGLAGGGGGGGGTSTGGSATHGGGNGGNSPRGTGSSGVPNTGGGGGGAGGYSNSSTTSGAGGSGVVIIRYLLSTYSLAFNVNPSDGNNAGYYSPMWNVNSNIGSLSQALSHDYKSLSVWTRQFQCLAVARHNGAGIADGIKVWKLSTQNTLANHFQSSDRAVVTSGGPVQVILRNGVNYSTDPMLASSGANNNLAFNWRYSNNGVRVILTDVGHWSGTLSGETINDDDSHGIGNDFACDHANQIASDWWFDVGKLQGDCHADSCTILGTDQGGNYLQETKYGNYAFLIAETDSEGNCPVATWDILHTDAISATSTFFDGVQLNGYGTPGQCIGYDTWKDLFMHSCTGGVAQKFVLTSNGLIAWGGLVDMCLLADGLLYPKLRACDSSNQNQIWTYENGQFKTGGGTKCLSLFDGTTRLSVADCTSVTSTWYD